MKYFCVPDIHGEVGLLETALARFRELEPAGAEVIFLGDYIDRGPSSSRVIDVVRHPAKGWTHTALMGNHEDMFLDTFFKTHPVFMAQNFFDPLAAREMQLRGDEWLQDAVKWMGRLPHAVVRGKNVFAHAWFNPSKSIEDQDPFDVMWKRFEPGEAFVHPDKYFLVHGHTIIRGGPEEAEGRVNLDCGAHAYGRLVCAEFEKGVTGPVRYHEFTR